MLLCLCTERLEITAGSVSANGLEDRLVSLRAGRTPVVYQCKHLVWTMFQERCAPSSPVTSAPALGSRYPIVPREKEQPAVMQYLMRS